jgi:hypothetical protein
MLILTTNDVLTQIFIYLTNEYSVQLACFSKCLRLMRKFTPFRRSHAQGTRYLAQVTFYLVYKIHKKISKMSWRKGDQGSEKKRYIGIEMSRKFRGSYTPGSISHPSSLRHEIHLPGSLKYRHCCLTSHRVSHSAASVIGQGLEKSQVRCPETRGTERRLEVLGAPDPGSNNIDVLTLLYFLISLTIAAKLSSTLYFCLAEVSMHGQFILRASSRPSAIGI